MIYYATKNGITKTIDREHKQFYEDNGYEVTHTTSEDIDVYDEEEMLEGRIENPLRPIKVDGKEISADFSDFTCINTKTYVEEPSRTLNGSIPNINDYETFNVARMKVTYDYMPIGVYRELVRLLDSKNEHIVEYYDYELCEVVKHNMYLEPRDIVPMHNRGYSIEGVKNVTFSFIDTLNEITQE